MKPIYAHPALSRLTVTTSSGLLLMIMYAGTASAVPYVCEYYAMPGYVLKKTITVSNATDTTDALKQAKTSFQAESFYDANFNWIYCKP